MIQTYESDEFGVQTGGQGSLTQPFGYTGEQRDAESGFVYLRARTYDPATGRFLQRDPFAGAAGYPLSLNRFTYVENNPIAAIDPSGLASSRAAGDGSGDNECLSTAGGLFDGNIVLVQCLDIATEVRTVLAVTNTATGPRVLATVLFAKPPRSGSGGGGDASKSSAQRASEKDIWKEATKGLMRSEVQRLHNKLKDLRVGARNADPTDILALRQSEFPDKPYPGGWLDKYR